MQRLRQSFVTGFFITVPLVISVGALLWIFRILDGVVGPLFARWLGVEIPGLGLVTTVLVVLLVGILATNVLGSRLLQTGERLLLRVPVFKTIYSPVKQLVAAFNPDNDSGFKRVVLAQLTRSGLALGFLTREFTVERESGPEPMVAVYVPTNHLYLGDVWVLPRTSVSFPDMSVEEGVRVFLTGGTAMPRTVRTHDWPSSDP